MVRRSFEVQLYWAVMASRSTSHRVMIALVLGTLAAAGCHKRTPTAPSSVDTVPTLAAISVPTGEAGAVLPVTLTGTNFVAGATTVAVTGSGITIGDVSVASATSLTATFTLAGDADPGARSVTVKTAAGTSEARTFTITAAPAPNVATVSPASAVAGSTVTVTFTGTNFLAGLTEVTVSGDGVTVTKITTSAVRNVGSTSLQVTLTIAAAASHGPRTITVTTPGGSTHATFTVAGPVPTLSDLHETEGAAGSDLIERLTGTGFVDGATVAVSGAGVRVEDVVVSDSTAMRARFKIDGDAARGDRDVTVTTPDGTSNALPFTITEAVTPAPGLTGVSPTSGSTLGGLTVTLTGTSLTGATAVTFGGVAAGALTVVNATTVTATTPAHAAGAVDVAITTPGGTATRASSFTYLLLPTITSLAASSGTASGGTGITVTGTNLTGATGLTFDGVAATSVNVVNSTTVTAVTPAHAAGAVDVVVTTGSGSGTKSSGFTYVATAVGQKTGGGVIAALNGGSNNLIAATADNSTGVQWGGLGTAVGASAQSNTDGASNTAAIVSALGNNGGTPYAAKICSDFAIDSQGNTPCQAGNACYSDWFLPAGNNATASGQLNALFTNRVAIGGFASTGYWSSTEFSANPTVDSYNQQFPGGIQGGDTKTTLYRVRCVRAFTP